MNVHKYQLFWFEPKGKNVLTYNQVVGMSMNSCGLI